MNKHNQPGVEVLESIEIDSPVGTLTLVADHDALVAVLWPDDDPSRVRLTFRAVDAGNNEVLGAATSQLGEYFAGTRTDFELNLAPGGTDFQSLVWAALRTIEYGQTRTYGELASAIGRPTAARAVGTANGRNPLSIVVPCHRVVASTGELAGFAGGLATKRQLLDLEHNVINARGAHT